MPVTLTWTGHATWLIDTGAGVLLVDPFFDECPTASMKAGDVACDAILVTHGHFDHVADLAAIAKRTGAKVFCNWEIGQWLGGQGVANVQPMNLGGTAPVPGGTAKMELAWHSSKNGSTSRTPAPVSMSQVAWPVQVSVTGMAGSPWASKCMGSRVLMFTNRRAGLRPPWQASASEATARSRARQSAAGGYRPSAARPVHRPRG